MPPRGNVSDEALLDTFWWMCCFPFALYRHKSKQHTKRRFIEELDTRSDKLCWACTAYFVLSDSNHESQKWPVHYTEAYWKQKNSFGTLDEVEERSKSCVCCKFLASFYKATSYTGYINVEPQDWGFWVGANDGWPWDWTLEEKEKAQIGTMLPLYRANLAKSSSVDDIHIVDSNIDWNVAKSWLDNCEESHGKSCISTWNSFWKTLPDMRIVDVQEMTILWPPPPDCKYAVLSYTWGGVTKTKIKNPTRRKIDLWPYHKSLPQTIKDAITVTRNMGLRYLWVDALCIQSRVEGDGNDEASDEAARMADEGKQFSNMHMIYGMASICIVAAQGSSANDGLWGVARNPSEDGNIPHPRPHDPRPDFLGQQRVDITDDTTLVGSIPLPGSISTCGWASRAWCLQEQLFSKRYLVFFDNQVYFQCKKGMWFEDMPLHSKHETIIRDYKKNWGGDRRTRAKTTRRTLPELQVLGRIEEINIDVSRLSTSVTKSHYACVEKVGKTYTVIRSAIFKEYQSIITLYSQRQMSFPTDALKAVDGLLSVVKAGMHTNMLFGLPESMLDVSLLWRSSKPLVARGRDTKNHSDSLPSWSWAGWTGSVSYEPLLVFQSKGRKLREVDLSVHARPFYSENIRPFVSWFKPRQSSNNTVTLNYKDSALDLVNGTGIGIEVENNQRPDDWNQAFKIPGYEKKFADASLFTAWSPTHLHAWTMRTDDFTTRSEFDESLRTSTTRDQHRYITHGNKVIGELWLDELGTNRTTGRVLANPYGKVSLVVVSEARYFRTERLNEENETYNWPNDFLLYNVLLVSVVEGVSYRKGVGRVTKIGWGGMGGKWEFVRLG